MLLSLVLALCCMAVYFAVVPTCNSHAGTVEAIWGSQAALLGFAVAVAVFGLQLGRDAWRGRAIAIAPRLEAAVLQGIGLLCVTGVFVLLRPVAARETAIAAVLLAATIVWLIVLVSAFLEVKRLTGLQAHLEIRKSRVLGATSDAFRRSLEARVGARILQAAVAANGGSTSPLLMETMTPKGQVRYDRSGTVIDIRLCGIAKGAREAGRFGGVEVSTALWRRVNESQTFATVDGAVPSATRVRLRNAIRIRRQEVTADIAAELRLLSDYALDHLEDEAVVDFVLDGYVEVLRAYAAEWAAYAPALTKDLLPDFFSGEAAPIDPVISNLVRLAREAVAADRDSALASIAYFPARLISVAVRSNAPGYLSASRGLSKTLVKLSTGEGVSARQAQALRRLSWEALTESLSYQLRRRTTEDEPLEGLRSEVRTSIIEVLRELLVAGDLVNFREGLRRWRIAERHLVDEAQGEDLDARPRRWEVPVVLAAEVVRLWKLGRVEGPRAWLETIAAGADAQSVVAAVADELANPDRYVDMGSWEMEDLQSHEGHFLEGTSNLITAMNWLLLIGLPARLSAPTVLYQMREQIRTQIARLGKDSDRTGSALGLKDPTSDIARLREVWERALADAQQREGDQLRARDLSDTTVSAIRAGVNAGRQGEFPRRLLIGTGRSRVVEDAVFEDRAISNAWVPKVFLVDDEAAVASDDTLVRSFLHSLGSREAARLWLELRRVAEIVTLEGNPGDRIAAGVERLRARGGKPSAAFTVVDALLWQDPRYELRSGSSPGADGSFEGLDVFMLPYRGTSDVFVVDLEGVDQQVRTMGHDLVALQAREATQVETEEHFKGESGESTRDVYVILTLTEAYHFDVDPAAVVRVTAAPEPEIEHAE